MTGVEWGEGGGFAALPHWLVSADVSDRAIRLWAVLARYADYQTGEAYPSRARLASDLRCSLNSVDRALTELMAVGAVSRRRRWNDATGEALPSIYTLHRVDSRTRAAAAAIEVTTTPAEEMPPGDVPELTGSVRELASGLVGDGGVVDAYLGDDYAGDPLSAYRQALRDAEALGREFPDVSKDPVGYLSNAVLARAAGDLHEIPARQAARLHREAKALGRGGHDWLLLALAQTASSSIQGDPVSYVIAAARKARAAALSTAA